MYRSVIIVLILVAYVKSMLYQEDPNTYVIKDGSNDIHSIFNVHKSEDNEGGLASTYFEKLFEEFLPRVRRQVHGSLNTNPDGISTFAAKIPITGNDKNMLSAVGSVAVASEREGYKAAGGGLAWDNIKGYGASLTGQHIPGFGDQLTAAGKASLFHNDKHDVTASAFATRNFPNNPIIPNFNQYGGKVGYTYDNKIGASLGAAHTDIFKKTDYSAMGNLNLFRDKTSSLDLNAGWSKSVSPYMPSSRWEPSGGLTFTKWFKK